MSDKVNDMAFEHFIEEKPTMLWRVVWWRLWGKSNNRRLRCTDYFGDQQKAWDFAGMRTEIGHEVASVDQFELKPVESSASSTMELKAYYNSKGKIVAQGLVSATSSESTKVTE